MRTLLLIVVVGTITVRGEEPRAAAERPKMRARVMELVPPYQPAKPSGDPDKGEDVGSPVVVMSPMIVSESRRAIDLAAAAIARESQKRAAERFSTVNGGTLYSREIGGRKIEVGGWWSSADGWTFLKISW